MITPNKIFILWRKRECSNLYFVDLRDDTNEKQLKAYANRSQIQVYYKRKISLKFSKLILKLMEEQQDLIIEINYGKIKNGNTLKLDLCIRYISF